MDVKDYPADQLTEVYIKIRDKRDALQKKFDEEYKVLEEQLALISTEMLE